MTVTKILFVDTGNYSRSPAAEVMARSVAEARGVSARFEFSSAGVIDKHVGGPPDPRTAAICKRKGYDLEGFVCRQATQADFQEFDQILAMDGVNRQIFELARRAGDKADVALFDPERDIPDPFYGDDAGFEVVVDMIEARIKVFLAS